MHQYILPTEEEGSYECWAVLWFCYNLQSWGFFNSENWRNETHTWPLPTHQFFLWKRENTYCLRLGEILHLFIYPSYCRHILVGVWSAVVGIRTTRTSWDLGIGEGPEYRPFLALRSVPKAGRPREQVENHGRGCTQAPVVFLQGVARVNQQPPMHQLAVLSTGWAVFFHSASNGFITVHFFSLLTVVLSVFLVRSWLFFPWTWPHTWLP